MFVSYTSLPPTARIWIYQANRPLTNAEVDIISTWLKSFTEEWMVHGQPLEASFEIRYNRFILLAANDQTSGCSIDSSVRAVKEIGERLGVDFFDRQQVCFKSGDEVFSLLLTRLKEAFANGKIDVGVYVFNNLVDTKGGVEQNWLQQAGNSWIKRYLPQGHIVS